LRLILIGFGVVGQSFVKLLLSRTADLYNLYGIKPRVVACIDNGGSAVSPQGLDLNRLLDVKRTKGTVASYQARKDKFDTIHIIENVGAEVLIELTPTNLKDGEPGILHITTAMKYGKNVITVNKGPLALAFPSLIELARFNNVNLRFSGTVGGGTSILEFAKRCLRGDRIVSFRGILNGTTNYILTKMEDGLNFQDALIDAKNKGYAEKSPSLDVEGYDAAAKLAIMANWIMGMKVTIKDVNRSGISKVKLSDIQLAQKEGKAIKLIARCNKNSLDVKPTYVSKIDPICVNGTLNAVTFTSEHSGQQTIIGRGAGGIETASAILRDLIEIKDTITEKQTIRSLVF